MIFSRNRGSGGRHHRVDPPRRGRQADHRDVHDEVGSDESAPQPTRGPYDVPDAPAGVERLDLGSLQIPAVAGVEVRLQADPNGQIQQVVLVAGENALQVGAFAAPRTEGIWDEVREEIRAQLSADGMATEEVDGAYGVELRARVRTPDGVTDLRFVGIDGPRWMVRGVYQGPAAADPAQAGPLAECLEGLVVDRGREAMPAREALPLRLPPEVASQAAQPGGEAGEGTAGTDGPALPADAEPSSGPRHRA
ncbi:DUF3710 domain-containing protein [Planosporangium sp. 12N6]|uniref:DUF3710 domain-containing protein n=1 Tax=Planosporangium spinosum TaxID=3402278 RepID=UPI003CE73AFC